MARLAAIVWTLAALMTPSLTASNMGFKQDFAFPAAGTTLHWLALPLQYAGTDAEALCADLPGVGAVVRWDEATSTLVSYACGDPSPFTLDQGTGYAVQNAPGTAIEGPLVGAHVTGFAFSLPPTTTSNLAWVSVPYHLDLPDYPGTPPGNDAEDLCQSVGGAELFAVVAFDEALGAYAA